MATEELSESARKRGLAVMLVGTLLIWGGFFMVIPLIAIHYVDDLGWAAGAVGLVLGVRQLTQQGTTLVCGALADRFGPRLLIAAGMLLRAISFIVMGFADTYPLLMISALMAAIGGAFFDSPSSAAMVALTREHDRARFYSILGVVSGIGMTVGPLLGALLLRFNFATVAFVAAGSFFVAFLITLILMPNVRVSSGNQGFGDGIMMALRDRRFMLFNVLLMGYWFMWVQLTISMPLVARSITGTADAVSWVYALNAGLGIILQYPLLLLAERWLKPLPIMIIGITIMALALGLVGLAQSTISLLACVVIFALGRMLATPTQQTVAASLANPAALGSYFGVSALALAIGGGVGNTTGGMLYGWGVDAGLPWMPWLIYAIIGLASAVGLMFMMRSQQRQIPQQAPAEG
ncbi:MAG: MFS transporter [Roseiflexaceae bacterium]